MKFIDFSFQISLFGNFDEIRPTKDTIDFLIKEFSVHNLLPIQFSEFNTNDNSSLQKTIRLGLGSFPGDLNILIGHERIECTCKNIELSENYQIDKESIAKLFLLVIESISNKFLKKSFKRIGFVTKYLAFDNININDILNNFNYSPIYNQKDSIVELSSKFISRDTIYIPNKEIINVSEELTFEENNNIDLKKAIKLEFDINTLPTNLIYRFELKDIEEFLNQTITKEYFIYKEYKNKLNSHG